MEDFSIQSMLLTTADDSTVEIFPYSLENDVQSVISVMKAGNGEAKQFYRIGVEYYRQGLYDQFNTLLHEATLYFRAKIASEPNEETSVILICMWDAMISERLTRASNISISQDTRMSLFGEAQSMLRASDSVRETSHTKLARAIIAMIQEKPNDTTGALKSIKSSFSWERQSTFNTQSVNQYITVPAKILEGCVSFSQGKYNEALDCYLEVLSRACHSCPASLRTGIGHCCWKLGIIDRASHAFERALRLDPFDVDALIASSILNLHKSCKTASPDPSLSATAISRFQLANQIDRNNPVILLQMANYVFWSWVQTPFEADIVSPYKLLIRPSHVPLLSSSGIRAGSLIKLGADAISYIASVDEATREIALESPLSRSTVLIGSCVVFVKDFDEAEKLVTSASRNIQNPMLLTEAYFLFGRIHHSRGNLIDAEQFYTLALGKNSKMTLARFGLVQVLIADDKMDKALDHLKILEDEFPDDVDVVGMTALALAKHNGQETKMDKLRHNLKGFRFEVDVWLSQANLRVKSKSSLCEAVECFDNALALISKHDLEEHPNIRVNLSGALIELGRFSEAKACLLLALEAVCEPVVDYLDLSTLRRYGNEAFWKWSQIGVVQRQIVAGSRQAYIQFERGYSQTPLLSGDWIRFGDDLSVGTVSYLQPEEEDVSFIMLKDVVLSHVDEGIPIYVQAVRLRPTPIAVPAMSNFGLLLERTGDYDSAMELYTLMLMNHPNLIDIYHRLAVLNRDAGEIGKAQTLLNFADEISPDCVQTGILRATILELLEKKNQAMKCYEAVCKAQKHYPQGMIGLGNHYFAKGKKSSKGHEKNISYSNRFFSRVLTESPRNVYAANGIGMLLANAEQFDAAKEIFSKIRELTDVDSTEALVNLAHTNSLQLRSTDAIKMYQTALKSLATSLHGRISGRLHYVQESLAGEYLKCHKYFDCQCLMQTMLRDAPSKLRDWYNLAIILADSAVSVLRPGAVKEWAALSEAVDNLDLATRLFQRLQEFNKDDSTTTGDDEGLVGSNMCRLRRIVGSSLGYDPLEASNKYILCGKNLLKAREAQSAAKHRDEERQQEDRKKEEVHLLELEKKRLDAEALEEQNKRDQADQDRIAYEKFIEMSKKNEEWAVASKNRKKSTATSSSNNDEEKQSRKRKKNKVKLEKVSKIRSEEAQEGRDEDEEDDDRIDDDDDEIYKDFIVRDNGEEGDLPLSDMIAMANAPPVFQINNAAADYSDLSKAETLRDMFGDDEEEEEEQKKVAAAPPVRTKPRNVIRDDDDDDDV